MYISAAIGEDTERCAEAEIGTEGSVEVGKEGIDGNRGGEGGGAARRESRAVRGRDVLGWSPIS